MNKFRCAALCLCSFYVHMMSFGMSSSFSIIYVELQELFHASKSATTWVQSLFAGVLLLSGSMIGEFINYSPHIVWDFLTVTSFVIAGTVSGVLLRKFGCRIVSIAGSILLTVALMISNFAQSLEVLYVTFAVGGVGASFMHAAAFVVILKNFDTRRALAVGVTGTGVSVGSLVLPILTYVASQEYGIRGSFLILACLVLQSVVAGCLFGILSQAPTHDEPATDDIQDTEKCSLKRKIGKHFRFLSVGYVLYVIAMNLMTMAYFIPFLMFPDVAISRGLSKQQASIIATCLGVGATVGRSAFAFVGDIKRVDSLFLHITPVALFGIFTFAVVFVWDDLGFVFLSICVGLASAPAVAMHPIIVSDLVCKDDEIVALGWLWFLASIATIVGPPIAGWITDMEGSYKNAIVFSGSLLLASSLAATFVLLWKRQWKKNVEADLEQKN